ncbi:methyltransferase domain-containing protein [Limnoglobus roseus]|uniref:Methyltransferase domain-containing protein n=1 Tax=Limnoglobus roseus TaxID=2598579 RepID=A0A5C1AD09_9BACT|nr:methyltransferase domain-containing protein [Limnoglobus roseus]QEL17239.1 methyltransferase domain-containing protein [Limnoglobus roseus]
MARRSKSEDTPLPPLYAMLHAGLEPVVADEITRDLGGEVKKTRRGTVIFRLNTIDEDVVQLRTTEDVYLLAWGSDTLTYKAADLKSIEQWTAKQPDWKRLFQIHHAVRGMPKGKPTFHLVCQMTGEHGFRRVDALDAMADGLKGKIPGTWQPADENAWLEIWLTITGRTAVCGVRLSDRTMRHRAYKREHVAASLRPSVAGAMVRLAGAAPDMTVLDPFCGAGTILAEQIELSRRRRAGHVRVIGGDLDATTLLNAQANIERLGPVDLCRWDATALPLAAESVDRIITNPPFGKQLSAPELIPGLYRAAAKEWNRVLRPGGRAVFLVAESVTLREAVKAHGWQQQRELKVRVLGQLAVMSVWQKP